MKAKYLIKTEQFIYSNQMTPESVYLLGLLWADGTLAKNTTAITITCIKTDLSQINNVMLTTGNWAIYYRTPPKGKEQQTFYVNDKLLYSFLLENDYIGKSFNSANKILHKIPENLRNYWWRGFFDGDGCIHLSEHGSQLFLTSGLNQDWSFFDFLPIKLDWKHIKKETNKGSYSRMLIQNKKSILAFYNYIYSGVIFGFERKRETFIRLQNRKRKVTFRGTGVSFFKRNNSWIARILFLGKRINLGYFKNRQEAIESVQRERQKIINANSDKYDFHKNNMSILKES